MFIRLLSLLFFIKGAIFTICRFIEGDFIFMLVGLILSTIWFCLFYEGN